MRIGWPALLLCALLAGCGTSKWTDTSRTATEQLLISDAMDRAVSRLDFRALAGKKVYLDNDATKKAVDNEYLTSSMRQHMLASGCILKDKDADADYIVELRVGAVGTDHHDVLYGVPSVNVPTVLPLSGVPTTIPEIPLAKKTDQRAVVKLAVFAYNRQTGRPVWQSGIVPAESQAKDLWFFGAGPFQRGTIYEGTNFAGDKFDIPLINLEKTWSTEQEAVSVADEAYFVEPTKNAPETAVANEKPKATTKASDPQVVPASANESSKAPPEKKAPATPEAPSKEQAKPPAADPVAAKKSDPPPTAPAAEATTPALLPANSLLDQPLRIQFPGIQTDGPRSELQFNSLPVGEAGT